ncbi:MAG: hypothetical protein HY752_02350 [Nitrospirae bacterium]|nr:hypothetical protein [Nitrospirota bacterium]
MQKRFLKRLENIFAAVAFAEEGEFETAREIMLEKKPLFERIEELKHEVALTVDDLTSMAIVFAETGEHEKAMEILKEAEDRLVEIKLSHQKNLKGAALALKMSSI